MRAEGAVFAVESGADESRIDFLRKTFHCWTLHARPQDTRRSFAREESDTLNCDGEGFPAQPGQRVINVVASSLVDLPKEFQSDMYRVRSDPACGICGRTQLVLHCGQALPYLVRHIDGNKYSHHISSRTSRVMFSAACVACHRIRSLLPGSTSF